MLNINKSYQSYLVLTVTDCEFTFKHKTINSIMNEEINGFKLNEMFNTFIEVKAYLALHGIYINPTYIEALGFVAHGLKELDSSNVTIIQQQYFN